MALVFNRTAQFSGVTIRVPPNDEMQVIKFDVGVAGPNRSQVRMRFNAHRDISILRSEIVGTDSDDGGKPEPKLSAKYLLARIYKEGEQGLSEDEFEAFESLGAELVAEYSKRFPEDWK